MQENIKKVAERGERLDSLQDKTGVLTTLPSFILKKLLLRMIALADVFKYFLSHLQTHSLYRHKVSEEVLTELEKQCGGRYVGSFVSLPL